MAHRWLITGGNAGIGLQMVKRLFPWQRKSISRSNGYDIISADDRARIAEESLNFDVIVNNAHDGAPHHDWADFGQAKLLQEISERWKRTGQSGYIFNISSTGAIRPARSFDAHQLYRMSKIALEEVSYQLSREHKEGQLPFRTTILRPSRLDTPKTRSRASWNGRGVHGDVLFDFMKRCLATPSTVSIPDITFD